MLIQEVSGVITVSSGTGFATINIYGGELRQIIIQPTTSTNEYDFTITNNLDFDVVTQEGEKGTYTGTFYIPVKNNCTLTINNASIDEDIKYYVSFFESYG